jgi:hypothetical protein
MDVLGLDQIASREVDPEHLGYCPDLANSGQVIRLLRPV